MRPLSGLSSLLLASTAVMARPSPDRHNQQSVLREPPTATATATAHRETGVGHFSEWSRATKKAFLIDWQAGRASEWTIVQGNEGGDLDSMTSALTWAYHLSHSTLNTTHPVKVIALLQTPSHALDLRPENLLALDNSQMTRGHEDMLTLDELPEDPETLGPKLTGIVVVDHAEPLRKWRNAKILSLFDHHVDRGAGPDAQPRIFERTASCTTIVARQMLDELERLPQEYHMPHELLELVLSAIAIDSGGLGSDRTTADDVATAARILKRSAWPNKDLRAVMRDLDEQLSAAKQALDHLGLRDLLRRDWKGDLVDTPSPRTPTVSLGFASVPYSMDEQIAKTDFAELFDWFAIEAAWTAEVGVDVSIVLNKYSVWEYGRKKKMREISLVVRNDVRVDERQANELFGVVRAALEGNKQLGLRPWYRAAELAPRQMVWTHESGEGRKGIRPIVEAAVRSWDRSEL